MTTSNQKIKTTVQTIYENSEKAKRQAKANLATNQKRTQPILESLGVAYLPVFKEACQAIDVRCTIDTSNLYGKNFLLPPTVSLCLGNSYTSIAIYDRSTKDNSELSLATYNMKKGSKEHRISLNLKDNNQTVNDEVIDECMSKIYEELQALLNEIE